MTIATIIQKSSLTVVVDGVPHTILAEDPRFTRLRDFLTASEINETEVRVLLAPGFLNEEVLGTIGGDVTIYRNRLLVDDQEINGYVVDCFIKAYQEGVTNAPLLAFIRRLQKSPSARIVNDLYRFIEVAQLPLDAEGRVICYKIVNIDFTDIYTGKMDNSPGKVVSIPRNQVDDNPDRTCSYGLHVCSASYLPHYGIGGSRKRQIVVVAVNPEDFVSFPRDYNNSKARVSSYEVLKAVETDAVDKIAPALSHTWHFDIDYFSGDTYFYLSQTVDALLEEEAKRVAEPPPRTFFEAVHEFRGRIEADMSPDDHGLRADLALFDAKTRP